MKYRLMKVIVIGFTFLSILSMSGMLTQDEGAAFGKEVHKLIESGVSKEEIENYLEQNGYSNDIVGGTQALKEAEASGYFNNSNSSTPAAVVVHLPASLQ